MKAEFEAVLKKMLLEAGLAAGDTGWKMGRDWGINLVSKLADAIRKRLFEIEQDDRKRLGILVFHRAFTEGLKKILADYDKEHDIK